MKLICLGAALGLAGCSQQGVRVVDPAPPAGWTESGVVEFCHARTGRKVGDGECWSLADAAMKAAGKERPGGDLRVWGRRLDLAKEKVWAGDILEFENAQFREERVTIVTGSRHTAVAMTGERDGKFIVAEQNFGGRKFVTTREMNLRMLVSGRVSVYRPQ